MKKAIAVLALVLGISTAASAQYFSAHAGFRGYGSNTLFYQAMNGGYIGAEFVMPELLGPLDLGVGVNISSLVGARSFRYGASESYKTVSNDLEIPVFLQYGFDLGDVVLNIFAGPTFFSGLTLREGIKSDGWSARTDLYKEANVMGFQYKRFDCLVGGGVSVVISDHFMLRGSVDYGLVNRCGNEITQYFSEGRPSFHNLQYSFGFAYVFE